MTVEFLLTAITKLDGDAVVLHVGEHPHLVTADGQVELSSEALTPGAVDTLIAQFLSSEQQRTLDQLGAVEFNLSGVATLPDERFTVVATRGGDEAWLVITRQRSGPVVARRPLQGRGGILFDTVKPEPPRPEREAIPSAQGVGTRPRFQPIPADNPLLASIPELPLTPEPPERPIQFDGPPLNEDLDGIDEFLPPPRKRTSKP